MKITVTHSAFEKTATDVAIVKIPSNMSINEALEYAYRWTQNIFHGWSIDKEYEENEDANKDVEVHYNRADGLGHRSTSVGDILTVHDDYIGNVKFKVMSIGFEEIRELAYSC